MRGGLLLSTATDGTAAIHSTHAAAAALAAAALPAALASVVAAAMTAAAKDSGQPSSPAAAAAAAAAAAQPMMMLDLPAAAAAAGGDGDEGGGGGLSSRARELVDGCLCRCSGHRAACVCAEIHGAYLVSGGEDGRVLVHEVRSRSLGRLLRTFEGHTTAIITISSAGSMILSASRDGTARLWDMHTGTSGGSINLIVSAPPPAPPTTTDDCKDGGRHRIADGVRRGRFLLRLLVLYRRADFARRRVHT